MDGRVMGHIPIGGNPQWAAQDASIATAEARQMINRLRREFSALEKDTMRVRLQMSIEAVEKQAANMRKDYDRVMAKMETIKPKRKIVRGRGV
jgi:Tfp pilus assembly pilus retraction ATPase PilT